MKRSRSLDAEVGERASNSGTPFKRRDVGCPEDLVVIAKADLAKAMDGLL